jgi:hypothetical protein
MSGHGQSTQSCPAWRQQRDPESPAHVRVIGQAERVAVTVVQAPVWKAPQVYVTHWQPPVPLVFLDLRSATDTATILSRLGHEGLATLITMAVAVATEEPADQPEGADSDTHGHR